MRWAKYGYWTLPGVLSDKVIPDIGFTYEAVGQCDVPVVKIF